MKINCLQFNHDVLNWYDQKGRKTLPWRQIITPYRVWLSEIMLQQTQVTTVLPYYARFIERFPDIESLAKAALDEVLNLWAGLGYYARARNLHKTAQQVLHEFQGRFPNTIEGLQKLPGIGRSTAGAISSIAFNKAAPILDGNVKRLFTRLLALSGWPGEPKITEQLWDLANKLLPSERADDYTQALMDLGALVCTRQDPKCEFCPLMQHCLAYQTSQANELPTPKPRKKLPIKDIFVLLIYNSKGEILLEQRPPTGIWGGLWSLPQCPTDLDPIRWCLENYSYAVELLNHVDAFRHTFTHFHLDLRPVNLKITNCSLQVKESSARIWYTKESIGYGIPAPIQRLLNSLHLTNTLNNGAIT